ncbi:MAG: 4Fe-4S dicluster domain-containing protein [Chloroflexi bacterium]|nr:4Fe-4S dicluster domain-containing protein [Chloroflexota bacterium]
MTVLPETIVPSASFRKQVEEASGIRVSSCFQCERCTNGCPVTFAMDIPPHKLVRSVHLGLKDEVLKSDTIWVCACCQTCTTRCPNGIEIAHLMDTLRQISQREGVPPSQETVPLFHRTFLSSVRRHGRVSEAEMATLYALKSGGIGGLLKQAGLGLALLKRGKLRVLPGRLRAGKQVREIFRQSEDK